MIRTTINRVALKACEKCPEKLMCRKEDCKDFNIILNRLHEYESIGLEPSEIKDLILKKCFT
jgi:hypothetical protein